MYQVELSYEYHSLYQQTIYYRMHCVCMPLRSWVPRFCISPLTDRPFETIQNFHFQKGPLVLYTHGDTI